jgi:hypothetical protein
LGSNWKSKHVTFGLFEATEITWQALLRNLIELLNAYGLKNKIIAYGRQNIFLSNSQHELKAYHNYFVLQ